jgi:hypothetical protein
MDVDTIACAVPTFINSLITVCCKCMSEKDAVRKECFWWVRSQHCRQMLKN